MTEKVGGTVVVAEASDPVQAEIWLDALRSAGIEAATFERGVGAALGGAVTSGFSRFPVVVARGDLLAARNVISELDGATHLAPVRNSEEQHASRKRALVTVAAVVIVIIVAATASRVFGG